jgi:hypothetical protein
MTTTKRTKTRFPGWRHMTASERYNARMDALFERCRELERERRRQGLPPNLNLLAEGDL